MKVAAHMLAYNINNFLPDVIDNVGPHVDKIFVALSEKPWGYNPAMRTVQKNLTTKKSFEVAQFFDRIEFVEGDWQTEEQTRNACLDRAARQGFDWLITQDADEFYTEHSWRQIGTYLSQCPADIGAIRTTWYNFWKSAQYILVYDNGSIKDVNANFAVRCNGQIRFTRARIPTPTKTTVLDAPCFHFGWVLSDDDMELKIQLWKHTNEFDRLRWFRIKWKGWRERSRFLNPVHPTFWDRAIRTPFELPDFAQKYALTMGTDPEDQAVLQTFAYDTRHRLRASLKRLRTVFKRS